MIEEPAQTKPIEVKSAPFERPRVLIEWQSPTRLFEKKGKRYLFILGAMTALLMLALFILHQWALSFLVAAVAFVLYAFNTIEPAINDYQILTTGVKLSEKVYYFRDLRCFWVEEKKEQKILQVSTYLSFPHKLSILTPAEKEEEIVGALLKYLPYHQEAETDYLDLLDKTISFLTPRLPEKFVNWTTYVTGKLGQMKVRHKHVSS